jgi:hypothetical protein
MDVHEAVQHVILLGVLATPTDNTEELWHGDARGADDLATMTIASLQ